VRGAARGGVDACPAPTEGLSLPRPSAVREGGGEASVGVHAGQLLSREINILQGVDAVPSSGRQHHRWRYRESPVDPARSKNLSMRGVFMCENREIRRAPVCVISGRAARGRPRP